MILSYCLVGLVHSCTYLLSTCIVLYRPVPCPLGSCRASYATPRDITSRLLHTYRAHRRPSFRESAASQHSCFRDTSALSPEFLSLSPESRVPTILAVSSALPSCVPTIAVLCSHHPTAVTTALLRNSIVVNKYCCRSVPVLFCSSAVLQFCSPESQVSPFLLSRQH